MLGINKGLIVKSTGSWYFIQCSDGEIRKARLRGKIKLDQLKVTNPIAVGDWVFYEYENLNENDLVITSIEARNNYIVRNSVHKAAHAHLIACNIDQALLLVTLLYPKTSLGFIDRFLVSAEAFRIPCLLVFNKTDLFNEVMWEGFEVLKSIYEPLGYPCLPISVLSGTGLDTVQQHLLNKRTLISGHSGAGKSSLLNALTGNSIQKTGEVSNYAEKGVHTTTFAELFSLDKNTQVIDTPGIKEFGLSEIEKENLAHYFPEMRSKIGECKYANCLHENEPGCAVKQAVETGEIADFRYLNYLSMLSGKDNRR